MNQYQHLFFDLDHTLWDFERSSAETLTDLYTKYRLNELGIRTVSEFLEAFSMVNSLLWNLHNQSKADKAYIRQNRFKMVFGRLGLPESSLPTGMADEYLTICPTKPYLIDHAHTVLQALAGKYRLHIITNGFDDSQTLKLKSSGIYHFFENIVTSESTGHTKPAAEIFEYALMKANAHASTSLMIGDNPDTDIKGALLVGMEGILYNPESKPHPYLVKLEIKHLSELLSFL